MRKLTVKNFSVIKEAELEFGKITVLIGPQSSGKSLLCKLAFFLHQVVPEIAIISLRSRTSFSEFKEMAQKEFLDRFPASAWGGQDFSIAYRAGSYSISVLNAVSGENPVIEFDLEFSRSYVRWVETHLEEGSAKGLIGSINNGGPIVDSPIQLDDSSYIPTGRAFFSTPNKGFASFSNKNLDWITQRFSSEMDFNYRTLRNAADAKNHLLFEFGGAASTILGGRVVTWDGVPHFQLNGSDRRLPFELLSSGTLELLPLLNPLSRVVSGSKYAKVSGIPAPGQLRGPIFVEEPETGVFPKTQYHLVRLFMWLANHEALCRSFAITTHSPYLLSSFNNLIEAGQVAAEKPELRDRIAELIPEHFWVKQGDFKAYAIEEGILKSILAEDTGLVSDNYLDEVSETIGAEFDELLRLGYVEA